MTIDRLAEGYEPNFDLDASVGRQGELLVADVVEALRNGASVEVKTDERFAETGNLFFEFSCRGVRSGLAITHTELWVHVLGVDSAPLVLETAVLKVAARQLWLKGYIKPCRRGSHPTEGVCAPLLIFLAFYREAKHDLAVATLGKAA